MERVIGIKSVDFKIKVLGYGVVNWNGLIKLKGEYLLKLYENYIMLKLRGYINSFKNEYDEGII